MVYRRDAGRPKVKALAERIADINQAACVHACPVPLEALDDGAMRGLMRDPWPAQAVPPAVTLLCGLPNAFSAQARVNRLALQFGVPSLCAQVWREGRGAEITFTYPGITLACHRGILKPRYACYATGAANPVTSGGAPIFATQHLNAVKGWIAPALLHHGTGQARFGGLLARIGARNLVQLRLDPDLAETLGVGTFERVFAEADRARLCFGELV